MLSESIIAKTKFCIYVSLVVLFGGAAIVLSQSTEQINPTPISSNRLSGQIRARDIGDSRLTTYFYTFDGNRGDIFINVVTSNFNGDIDVFTVEGLKPRTKITIYADSSQSETGRVVYMRKPERLILRIQGRSPNDEPATYQIKFAGSFGALAASTESEELPTVNSDDEGTVRVNSVGTIIEDPRKDDVEKDRAEVVDSNGDVAKVAIAGKENRVESSERKEVKTKTDEKAKIKTDIPSVFDPRKKPATDDRARPRVVISDPFADADKDRRDLIVEITEKKKTPSAIVTIERVRDVETEAENARNVEKEKARALSKIKLVIRLKNGKKFEKRMSKVSSFNVFDGVLKVVEIDGKVTKFSILDVVKLTIE